MSSSPSASPTFIQKALAWMVHSFTASGLVAGFMAMLAINQQDWRGAMLWLLAALLIDGLDGSLARRFRVKEVLPYMDGKTMDYIIDFATYAIIPAYFFYMAELTTPPWNLICTIVILIVSALYYGKEGMVSNDMYFVGFPVMWNMVVFYLIFVFQTGPVWNTILIFIFAILHFVPIKFAYPSQAVRFRKLILLITVLFFVALIGILWGYPESSIWLRALAIGTALGYGILAVYNTWME
ncbi:MAG: CDP-alcohol phosphatidyltransferase family protein [Bacteroidota bacterium]